MKPSKTEQEPQWQKTPVANLVRNAASGTYYARVRVDGKLIWKSLKTDRMSVGQLRLGDSLKEERHRAEAVQATARGKMTFEQALKIYRERLAADISLKPRSKEISERAHRCPLEVVAGTRSDGVFQFAHRLHVLRSFSPDWAHTI